MLLIFFTCTSNQVHSSLSATCCYCNLQFLSSKIHLLIDENLRQFAPGDSMLCRKVFLVGVLSVLRVGNIRDNAGVSFVPIGIKPSAPRRVFTTAMNFSVGGC